jgi:hypothetical protein
MKFLPSSMWSMSSRIPNIFNGGGDGILVMAHAKRQQQQ